jgi:hypothetical protein
MKKLNQSNISGEGRKKEKDGKNFMAGETGSAGSYPMQKRFFPLLPSYRLKKPFSHERFFLIFSMNSSNKYLES